MRSWLRLLMVVGVLGCTLLVPSAAAAADTDVFATWSPVGEVPGEWQVVGSASTTFGNACPALVRQWKRHDGVGLLLEAAQCSEEDLQRYLDVRLARRQQHVAAWWSVPSALPDGNDFAGPAGTTAHLREWVEGDVVVVVIVDCPSGTLAADACLDVSADAVRSISAAAPGEPRPGPEGTLPPARCCAEPRSADASPANDILLAWEPGTALPGDWFETYPRHMWTDRFTHIVCNTSVRAWQGPEAIIFVQWWTCLDSDQTAGFARRAAVYAEENGRWSATPPALGPNADVIDELDPKDPIGHTRTWAQGGVAVTVGVECGALSNDACADLTADIVRDISLRLPGEVASTDLDRIFWWNGLGLGLLLVGGMNLFIRMGMRIEYLVQYPAQTTWRNWHDVSDHARQLRRRTRRRYVAQGLMWSGAAALLYGMLALFHVVQSTLPRAIAVAFLGIVVWRMARRRVRRLHVPEQAAAWRWHYRWPRVRLIPRRVLGAVLIAVATVLGLGAIALWLTNAWIHAGGDLGSPRILQIIELLSPLPTPLIAGTLTAITLMAGWDPQLKASVLLSGMAVATLIFRTGRRLCARSLPEMKAYADRPHLLLLRNFEDDKIGIRPSRLTQTGFIRATFAALSRVPMRPFQELLVRQLSEIGPVVAVAPRNTLVPGLGAAQAAFSDDAWQAEVRELAESARGVVFLAAPQTVNAGLRWELELVSNELNHGRVMLIIPPRVPPLPWWKRWRSGFWDLQKPDPLLNGWSAFRRASADLGLFAPIASASIPDGVHVLVHDPATGWHGWGASRRTDWTYAAALHEAAVFVEQAWPLDAVAMRKRPASNP